MESTYLKNGMKVIYMFKPGNLTSFSIGLDAGANVENIDEIGIAHMVEHMVFKDTTHRSEYEINIACDRVFGFNNAMTNFPYVIYYGTTLSQDFKTGLEIYSDILINPTFPERGFKEEKQVIIEELKEWKEDIYQYCEDTLLANAFKNRRLKELIIGSEENIRSISLENIKEFYSKYYCPENCIISIVSSLSYEDIINIVEGEFSEWRFKSHHKKEILYESNIKGIFQKEKEGIEGCKLQYCFPINNLNEKQVIALRIFNFAFGEGTSSILFDEIRTKNGFAYEVSSLVKNEKGIKLFVISLGTSIETIEKAKQCVENCILKVQDKGFFEKIYNEDTMRNYSKMIKLKQELKYEKSIILANALTTTEIMYNDFNRVFEELEELVTITPVELYETICSTLINPTIQMIVP
ncbi:MAG: insulinase family protein [Clostridiaceae bacterium]|nr:insulinase family protein [Clostridiaceae bacterium]